YTNNALFLGHASEMARQGRTRNTEQFCGTTLILICLLINDPDVSFHSAREREIDIRGGSIVIASQRSFSCTSIWLQVWRKNDMLGQNYRTIAKQRHGSHGMAQFTKISAPPMVKQLLHGFGMNCGDVFAFFESGGFHLRSDQGRQFLQPLTQRRNKQGEAVQTLIKVFPE